ncbi:hypothetical protein L914_15305 [Phytophthora nicotianae]|uniref:Uncharacterized protein n=1 Tax=Phytophthora nicotianae TaxID=4792 RepID=W2MRY9_PHYNI|nr:hypothetical protein L914_15305 [Phytophthora nicotianae]
MRPNSSTSRRYTTQLPTPAPLTLYQLLRNGLHCSTASKRPRKTLIGYRTCPTMQARYEDPVIAGLSARQRDLQLRIYNDMKANTYALRRESNAILHQIQFRCRDLATESTDDKIKRIEGLSSTAQVHEAVRDTIRTRVQPIMLHDAKGKYILDRKPTNSLICNHFQEQFLINTRSPIDIATTARPLEHPITADEFRFALKQLSNG